jgi:hypothetical protein
MGLLCEFCKKEYASYASKCNHIRKYHAIKRITQVVTPEMTKKIKCSKKYCNALFNNRQSKWRHEKKCDLDKKPKIFDEFKKENDELKHEIVILKESHKQELENFKMEVMKMIKKPSNNQTNNGTIINNSGTINNNINVIVPMGKENFNKLLTDDQKVSIVKANDKALLKFTELIYTNPDFENYRNISISNIGNEFGNFYDEKVAEYVLMKKIEIVNKYGWNRLCDIEEFIDDLDNKNIDVGNIDKLTVLIDRYAKDDEFKKIFNNDLVVLLYNYHKKVKRNINRINKKTKEIEI